MIVEYGGSVGDLFCHSIALLATSLAKEDY
jgi:hypothetical protein